MKELYETNEAFKTYVDKFVIYQRNKGNYISPEQSFEYAQVRIYAEWLKNTQ